MANIYEAFNKASLNLLKGMDEELELKNPIDSSEGKDEIFEKFNSLLSEENKFIKE